MSAFGFQRSRRYSMTEKGNGSKSEPHPFPVMSRMILSAPRTQDF